MFFLLNSRFYFILFIYTVILVFFTKWWYSLEVDFSIFGFALNPGSYNRMYCRQSMVLFHFWTLLCRVYRPYGLIFFANFNRSITAICWWRLFSNVPVSYKRDIEDCVIFESCAAPGEAFNILWYVLWIAHAALLMNVSMSAGSSELAVSISEVRIMFDRCAYLWQSLWEFLILVGLRFYAMLLLCMCVKLYLNITPVSYIKNSGAWVFLQPDFCQLINVCW